MTVTVTDDPGDDPAAAGWQPIPVWEGFTQYVGPFWTRPSPRGTLLGLRAAPQHGNMHGVVHGGMLLTLADTLMGIVAYEGTTGLRLVTISLNGDFVGAGRIGDWIVGRAWAARRGSGMIFMQSEFAAGSRTVLTATGIWRNVGTG